MALDQRGHGWSEKPRDAYSRDAFVADAAAAIMVDVQNTLVANPLLEAATDEQLARWVPRLATDTVGAYDVNGSFPVSGWAADVDGIARIDVQIDNLSTQSANYGDPRPDVHNSFPDLPSALYSGFLPALAIAAPMAAAFTLFLVAPRPERANGDRSRRGR